MLSNNKNSPPKGNLPLRLVLVLPFVLQIFAAVGLTGYLSLRNGQQAVNDLANRLQNEVSDRIDQDLDSYLNTGRHLAEINGGAMDMGLLDPNNPQQLGQFFWKQLQLHNIGYITFCLKTGDFAGAGRFFEDGRVTVDVSHKRNGNQHWYLYNTDKQGNRANLALDNGPYIPMEEAWCEEPAKTGKSMWTLYQWQSPPYTLSVSANRPVYDKNKNLIGVIGVDQRLTQISDFLQQLKVSPSGKTFILERNGLLIATSNKEQPFTLVNGKAKRLQGSDSKDPLIQATAKHLTEYFNNLSNIKDNQSLEFQLNNQRHFIQVAPWRDEWGLDWLVVVTVPESDFMGQINANTHTTILLCLGALILATILGFYTSGWIARPILRLSQASEAIAAGELNQQVEVPSVHELGRLAQSFNRMAQQLRDSFTTIEQTNQQLAKTNEELESRVEERTHELKEAKLTADAANHAKSDFLANMSHELRTPLNGILGYAQILARTASDEKQQRGIDIIYQCGSHLLTLINDILDLSKIEAGKLELHLVPFYLPALLQSVVEICRIKAEQKGIEFIYQPPENSAMGIVADEKRLRQVLINLLGNAIKFTDKGSVTFKVEVVLGDITNLRFYIQDTGIGMSPQQLEKIFLPFEQVGDSKRQSEGTGLGLAISRRFVELMASQIQVESQLGVGSKFFFNIDCAIATDWVQANSVTPSGRIVGYSGVGATSVKEHRKKILIVDDRWENRSVIVNLLQPLGFEVIEANNGEEGLEKITRDRPDMIICDLAMPIMDGWEMLKQLRQSETLRDAIVIVSSASVFEIDRQKSLAAGGNDFLAKPVQADELYAALAKQLQLNWVYTDTNIKYPIDIAASAKTIVIPSIYDLKRLLEHVETGYFRGIREELDQLAQLDEQYQPFIQELRQLVKGFNIQTVRHFLQESINQSQESTKI
ncbi:response regulator [Nostoc sp. CHAB 5784]|uniref:hybrid sensor histidine kinase/response regulator n=1 Tax=Nostoc mirabile TaxID=2907820 RepID=UPI001E3D7EE3|nr:hybrid sensor histidine kinase/response regulator [Nostoc mirabile]MCC5664689.1 response regulator [Nostoc mirabile CHAB5784]